MELLSNALANLVAFCGLAGLVFFILAMLFKYSPRTNARIKKLELLKIKLADVSKEQLTALNRMYECGAVNKKYYFQQRFIIKNNLRDAGIKEEMIDTLPIPVPINKAALLDDLIGVSSTLNDMGKMDNDKFNEYINQALDEKKKLK